MAVNPHPKNPGKWVVVWYVPGGKGKRAYKVLDCTEAEARAYEASVRKQFPEIAAINPKIINLVDDFHLFYKTNRLENTYKDCKKSFCRLSKHLGNYRFTDFTPTLIEQYKNKRLEEGVARRTINKELSYLSSFFRWSVENGHCNPLPFKIRIFSKVKSPKPEVPSPEVVQKIIDKVEKKYRPILLLLYDGGLRRTEALTLRAEGVNLDTRLMMVLGKGEKERVVPVATERLYEELVRAKKKVKTGFLFTNPQTGKPYDSIRKAIMRACEKAKVNQRVYHHLFRHSFGTHATVAGVGLKHLQDIMGHSTSKTTEMYTHLAGGMLKKESEKFACFIDKLKKPKVRKGKKKTEPV